LTTTSATVGIATALEVQRFDIFGPRGMPEHMKRHYPSAVLSSRLLQQPKRVFFSETALKSSRRSWRNFDMSS
jgi:hypothetical protein